MTKQSEGVKPSNRKDGKKDEVLDVARLERAARIKSLRETSGDTTARFAEKCGVTEVTQYNYERGTRLPDANYFSALYFSYAVDLGPLITGAPRAKDLKDTPALTQLMFRYQALSPSQRKTVDDVVELAWKVAEAEKKKAA